MIKEIISNEDKALVTKRIELFKLIAIGLGIKVINIEIATDRHDYEAVRAIISRNEAKKTIWFSIPFLTDEIVSHSEYFIKKCNEFKNESK